jgi:hypothetical protein
MARYRVYAHVEYEVEANSPEEASQIVSDGAEYPLLGFNETNFCNWSEVVLSHPLQDKREV